MTGQELRHRRRVRTQNPEPLRNGEVSKGRGAAVQPSSDDARVGGVLGDLLSAGNTIAGCLVMVALSYQFSRYLCQLHENDLWFSEIMVSVKCAAIYIEQLFNTFYLGGGKGNIVSNRTGALLFILQTISQRPEPERRLEPTSGGQQDRIRALDKYSRKVEFHRA